MRRGNWHKLGAFFAGVLLSLPLLGLLWRLLTPAVPADGLPGVRVSPMLTHDQHMRLTTYGKLCGPGKEKCESPLGCLFDGRRVRATCVDSECLTDAQCLEDEVCRRLATWGDEPQVRRCVPVGFRNEGETCVNLPDVKQETCAAQWLCSGREEKWCARPCRLDDSQGCPEGFFCADTVPQPACLPTCKMRGCLSGQQCIAFSEGASVCAKVYGPQCQQTPCPDGRQCDARYDSPHPGMVWMECVEECGDGLPPCGAGKVCDGWHCLLACDPHAPDVCGEGYHCSRRGKDRPYSCQPIYWDETMAN